MRFGIYLSGSLNDAIQFFEEKKPHLRPISAIQVYLNGSQRFFPSSVDAQKVLDFKKKWDVSIYIHSPNVISVVNHAEKSAESIKRHLEICDSIDASGLVVHSGSKVPIDYWIEFLSQFKSKTPILLENMPYKQGALDGESLNEICEKAGCGVCFDTVHDWVGTADMSGLKHVGLIHANQTKEPRWSGHDRHSGNHLNEGLVPSFLKFYLKFPFADVISEYAGEEWEKEIGLIRESVGNLGHQPVIKEERK